MLVMSEWILFITGTFAFIPALFASILELEEGLNIYYYYYPAEKLTRVEAEQRCSTLASDSDIVIELAEFRNPEHLEKILEKICHCELKAVIVDKHTT